MREGLSTDVIVFCPTATEQYAAIKLMASGIGLKIIDDAGNFVAVDTKYRAQMLIQALEQAIDFDWVK